MNTSYLTPNPPPRFHFQWKKIIAPLPRESRSQCHKSRRTPERESSLRFFSTTAKWSMFWNLLSVHTSGTLVWVLPRHLQSEINWDSPLWFDWDHCWRKGTFISFTITMRTNTFSNLSIPQIGKKYKVSLCAHECTKILQWCVQSRLYLGCIKLNNNGSE